MSRSVIRRTAAVAAALPLVASLTSCLAWEEREEPTAGYVRYPEGDVPDLLGDDYSPPTRYPELKPWVKDYVAWQEAGAKGSPPVMPPVG